MTRFPWSSLSRGRLESLISLTRIDLDCQRQLETRMSTPHRLRVDMQTTGMCDCEPSCCVSVVSAVGEFKCASFGLYLCSFQRDKQLLDLFEMSRKMEVIKHLLEDHYSCCWLHSLNLQLVFEHLIIETVPIFSYRSMSFMFSPPPFVSIYRCQQLHSSVLTSDLWAFWPTQLILTAYCN